MSPHKKDIGCASADLSQYGVTRTKLASKVASPSIENMIGLTWDSSQTNELQCEYTQTFLLGGVPGMALLSTALSSSVLASSSSSPFYNTGNKAKKLQTTSKWPIIPRKPELYSSKKSTSK